MFSSCSPDAAQQSPGAATKITSVACSVRNQRPPDSISLHPGYARWLAHRRRSHAAVISPMGYPCMVTGSRQPAPRFRKPGQARCGPLGTPWPFDLKPALSSKVGHPLQSRLTTGTPRPAVGMCSRRLALELRSAALLPKWLMKSPTQRAPAAAGVFFPVSSK